MSRRLKRLAPPKGDPNGPNCGVTAVAILVQEPFPKVFETIRKAAGYRRNWKGITTVLDQLAALRTFGVNWRTAYLKLPGRRAYTIGTWVRLFAEPGVPYLISTSNHTMTLLDGVICDQAGPVPVGEHYARRRTLHCAHAILD